MKIFLTFIILLFSSSVIANEDLSGKSIICKIIENNILESEKRISLIGFNFLKNYNVRTVFEDLYSGEIIDSNYTERQLYYETSYSFIKILVENESNFMKIDRESLNVTAHDESKILDEINGENCFVYNSENFDINFKKIKDKLIADLTKKNKL